MSKVIRAAVALGLLFLVSFTVAVDTDQNTTALEDETVTQTGNAPEAPQKGGVAHQATSEDQEPEGGSTGTQLTMVIGGVAALVAMVAAFMFLLLKKNKSNANTPSTRKQNMVINNGELPTNLAQVMANQMSEDPVTHVTIRNTFINSKKGKGAEIETYTESGKDSAFQPSARRVTFSEEDDAEDSQESVNDNAATPVTSKLAAKKVTDWGNDEATPDNVRKLRQGDGEAPPTQPRRGMASKLINKYESEPLDAIEATPMKSEQKTQQKQTPYRRLPPKYDIANVNQTPLAGKEKLAKDWYNENDDNAVGDTELVLKVVEEADTGSDEPVTRRTSGLAHAKLSRRSAREQSLDYSSSFDYTEQFENQQLTPAEWDKLKKASHGAEQTVEAIDEGDPAFIEAEEDALEGADEPGELTAPKLSRRVAHKQSIDFTPSFDYTAHFQNNPNDLTRPATRLSRMVARAQSDDEVEEYPAVEPFEDGDDELDDLPNLFTKLLRRPAGVESDVEDEDSLDLQALLDLAEPEARKFCLLEQKEEALTL